MVGMCNGARTGGHRETALWVEHAGRWTKDSPTGRADAESGVDRILSEYKGRGLERFFRPGGAVDAARALDVAKHVMIVTGFSVAEGMPETDGPPGAAALGHALRELGRVVTFVTGSASAPVLREAVRVLDPKFAKYGRFIEFDAPHGPEGDRLAADLVRQYKPDAVVAIELPARTANDGPRRNMRGVDINGFNPPLDGLVLAANAMGISTVGVGDGGNEAGMGGLKGIPTALDGSKMASAVPAQHPVTAWNSNLGAEAIAAVMLARHGKLDRLHTPEQQSTMIEATLAAGAVDGVTRGGIAGKPTEDGKHRTGVDGFASEFHAEVLKMLKKAVSETHLGVIAKETPRDGKPFLIGAFDSSNGGLIAAKNLAGFLEARSSHEARFAIVLDHGNAPYGEKSRDQLIKLVGNGLKTAEKIGVDVIAMACNTACTAFPEALDGLQKTKVLDLIEVTAKAIARQGGDKPVILATPATAKDTRYPNEVSQASNGGVSVLKCIGAAEWAPLINRLDHLRPDSATQASVDRVVKKYVDQIPEEATSVWLCCTHYPALKGRIEAALKERNLKIEVMDPMEHQAEAIISHLNAGGSAVDRSRRRSDLSPIVVTTGADIGESARALLEKEQVLVLRSDFGQDFDMQLLKPYLEHEKSAPASFATVRKFWHGKGAGMADAVHATRLSGPAKRSSLSSGRA